MNIFKKLNEKVDEADNKLFGKNKKLANIIIFAVIVVAAILVIVMVQRNKLETSTVDDITKIEADANTKNKDADKAGYIIKGKITDDGKKQTIVSSDGNTYEIENGKLYKVTDGKREALTDDLTEAKFYDDKGTAYNIVDGKLVTSENETNSSNDYAARDAEIAEEANENKGGATNSVHTGDDVNYEEGGNSEWVGEGEGEGGAEYTEPTQDEGLPWIYPYPTQTGIYKNSETGWLLTGISDTGEGFTAEQYAELDALSWKLVNGQISEADMNSRLREMTGDPVDCIMYNDSYAASWVHGARELIATRGYYDDLSWAGSWTYPFARLYNYYDAETDTAHSIAVYYYTV